ncbi:MAG: hypothetical protein JO256_00450 [Alphaproteobacteria bacterium]|nr:hypothetical protein [Alphaproteobacteria bacterium]
MAEEANSSQAEGGLDPVAMGAVLGRASSAVDAELIAYLRDQRHHLHRQLRPSIWEKWLGVFLRVATACVGLAFAGGVAWMVWEAKHSDGLKVQPFSVPPTFAERGLTGEAVAARVIDRLSELQSQTNTARPARSYSNAWGDKAIKLEIPETGVSLEELDAWLRAKFGHETSLSGEVVRNESGVTLTARTPDGAVSVSGAQSDIETLTGKLAEAIYRLTQPYRYATYLLRHENRAADAAPIFKQLALTGDAEERRWSYNMWAVATETATGDTDLGLRMYMEAHRAVPDATTPFPPMVGVLTVFGRLEEAVRFQKERLAMPVASSPRATAFLAKLMGNYADALATDRDLIRTGLAGYSASVLLQAVLDDQIGMHDLSAARATWADMHPELGDGASDTELRLLGLRIVMAAEDWRAVLAYAGDVDTYLKQRPRNRHRALVYSAPPFSLAQAHLGDFVAAERSIAPTRADCYPCLIARARIAEMQGQRARADFWFTRATEAGPSLPFAFEAEGRALLGRNAPDQAIARFTVANQKSPHFADPLEGWGEALMARNQSHLALAKFAEAEKYAPNWGRLHLKWGEALTYAGKPADAKAHFARAAALDLTPAEKAELTRAAHG